MQIHSVATLKLCCLILSHVHFTFLNLFEYFKPPHYCFNYVSCRIICMSKMFPLEAFMKITQVYQPITCLKKIFYYLIIFTKYKSIK